MARAEASRNRIPGVEIAVFAAWGECENLRRLDDVRLFFDRSVGDFLRGHYDGRLIHNGSYTTKSSGTLGRLDASGGGKRIMHLATHELTGDTERPYDASLALTRPKQITPDDIGFPRLDDLIAKWRGKLDERLAFENLLLKSLFFVEQVLLELGQLRLLRQVAVVVEGDCMRAVKEAAKRRG